jgi:hypothetical protein
MEIKMQGHSRVSKKAAEFWFSVLKDYHEGLSAQKIAKKYTNPRTNKAYTRQHIFWILKQIKTRI